MPLVLHLRFVLGDNRKVKSRKISKSYGNECRLSGDKIQGGVAAQWPRKMAKENPHKVGETDTGGGRPKCGQLG